MIINIDRETAAFLGADHGFGSTHPEAAELGQKVTAKESRIELRLAATRWEQHWGHLTTRDITPAALHSSERLIEADQR